ncbi:MAG: hypothetical protein IJJ82_00505 [Clostridia bacterium]|nr:hypothetical protein [Clostridia bacterium]
MSIQKIMNLMLVEKFPELKDKYEEEISWQEGNETGSHVVYGDIFVPFIKEKIEEKNDIKLEIICEFIEELIKMKNDYVEEVVKFSIIEGILDDYKTFGYLEKFVKEDTQNIINIIKN